MIMNMNQEAELKSNDETDEEDALSSNVNNMIIPYVSNTENEDDDEVNNNFLYLLSDLKMLTIIQSKIQIHTITTWSDYLLVRNNESDTIFCKI